ncbi:MULTISPECIES: glutamate synthase large subunit [Pseudidiomarina]|uniref:Glutamate synthase [NADPH] large chain n=2 Tax=Pseudidiomarina TaxID=2800384 RepID=A0A368V4P4_9GAMM|nr:MULTISPECIES: glutamate synthase large subunit [Pseudidiomarina]PWW16167.1 glutamate synthase (NADPH) large subunit [Pseudidiomarina maritima]RBP93323.1 glutamate synthase (NADPH) large subunit [Pseudidiomarina tainanensis]RCW35783.1 glutamate synthase (NADPH) large subunit [Pseudidiomarina tainanensis]
MAFYSHDDVRDNCGFGLIAQIDGKPSHDLVTRAITGLANMQHRGGINADGKTGDGCGLLLQLPEQFFRDYAAQQGWHLSKKFAVGMVFLSVDEQQAATQKSVLERELAQETLTVEGWREVPVDADILGELAQQTRPQIAQVIVSAPPGWRKKDLERRLFMARRRAENRLAGNSDFYVCSLSCLVIVYKGLMLAKDLAHFYLDLANPALTTSNCVFHQRFSTNTQPQWRLAQPFRFLAHNGEINAIRGNRQWAAARQYKFHSPLLPDLQQAAPFVNSEGSDSSALDNMLELLLAGGMDLFRALRLLIPPAWQGDPTMDDALRAFYEFNSMHMEPWDGPAGIVMSNGRHVACSLDRNGLRPARFILTDTGVLTIASEVGIWDYDEATVIEKGRLGPGQMLAVDTYNGRIWRSAEIDQDLQARHPYRDWLTSHVRILQPFRECAAELLGQRLFDDAQMLVYHKLFLYNREELQQVLAVLASDGHEATGSMGDDTPIALLSGHQRSLYDYFRQQFAQVTNPPIDPIRERHVMSLATCLGREQNVFSETSGYAERVVIESPVLMYTDVKQLRQLPVEGYKLAKLSLQFSAQQDNLEQALTRLCQEAVRLVREEQVVLLLLSDRDIDRNLLTIPAALAVGAVQQALVRENLRCDSNILVETASVRDAHHMAVLIGLGATAVYPFLAYESIEQLVEQGVVKEEVRTALTNYREGINKGLLKIMSKMGIATVASYRGACLFEVVGLADGVRQRCFAHAPARIGGAEFSDLQLQLEQVRQRAWLAHQPLPAGGLLKYVHGGEYHAYNPDVVTSLQQAVKTGDSAAYQRFADHVNQRPIAFIRDLLQPQPVAKPLPLAEVEPATALFHRFDSAAMSIGALSPEAHEALAEGMNSIGGHSNSGEGGEDPRRFGTPKNSRIKQIASGRFGVTPHYLVNADVLQIKIAQGAKPGEGGQLPGEKVSAEIARLRYAVPGTTLISPPPHHDIYSIEDLAQLIFDLKQVNPQALISVKLVSSPGIGTIATGVAKAYADLITVSGYDGGTGASPLTSVKHAGSPWELGLAEVQQALVSNNLRHKVRVQVDGGLKTGLDVIKAAILGAESFGFGTAPMVALGCKYLRICHLNNCATGVATQDETLRREHFSGLPERVAQYFTFVAEEVRYWLAQLGVAQLTDLIGRVDLFERVTGTTAMQQRLDVSGLLAAAGTDNGLPRHCTERNPAADQGQLNQQLLSLTEAAIAAGSGGHWHLPVRNYDRAVGAAVAGQIVRKYGNQGMAGAPITLTLEGSVGQSFGAFNAGGLRLELTGDANDYVGKGMAGGRLVIKPPRVATYASNQAIIMGNTCLYGATGGKLFAAGCAGERFAVRNSGATAVVEGIGDHGCEYMTGGIVVVLGRTGINFGAGMTGGFAYVWDQDGQFKARLNRELVEPCAVDSPMLQEHLRGLIHEHYERTGSEHAHQLLRCLEQHFSEFVMVKPKAADLADLVGHRARSTAELRVEVM